MSNVEANVIPAYEQYFTFKDWTVEGITGNSIVNDATFTANFENAQATIMFMVSPQSCATLSPIAANATATTNVGEKVSLVDQKNLKLNVFTNNVLAEITELWSLVSAYSDTYEFKGWEAVNGTDAAAPIVAGNDYTIKPGITTITAKFEEKAPEVTVVSDDNSHLVDPSNPTATITEPLA